MLRTTARDALRATLAERGIATAVHYPLSVIEQPAYRHLARHPCPEASRWAAEVVSVPCSPEMTEEEVKLVSASLADVQHEEDVA